MPSACELADSGGRDGVRHRARATRRSVRPALREPPLRSSWQRTFTPPPLRHASWHVGRDAAPPVKSEGRAAAVQTRKTSTPSRSCCTLMDRLAVLPGRARSDEFLGRIQGNRGSGGTVLFFRLPLPTPSFPFIAGSSPIAPTNSKPKQVSRRGLQQGDQVLVPGTDRAVAEPQHSAHQRLRESCRPWWLALDGGWCVRWIPCHRTQPAGVAGGSSWGRARPWNRGPSAGLSVGQFVGQIRELRGNEKNRKC